ncbi:Fe-S cluster assembly sulfur transfer protein SufU [Gluconacetobacter sacchari]|uniref:SUF system NifU family Fe-S cluster assembly protein n=2 Tax=Gluconacetobacter sacchari TaxID=92759 RepID=A0A7W4IEG7_9PROT|nr:SUF system NifU family Fe-S cluster assembly protein [Gluconacetobacter sacchari]MBB2161364.1 SUF system NifU family Fe-S cluster assembly protein [Gluconacetobacter sacchari]GBQ29727.1 NifU family SUF system FeS assembly protein [Gluconacetobacter sacchari DSM 12717]
MDVEGLYQRQVIERARAPVHAGPLEGAARRGEGTNPMCGDRVRVGVWLDADGRIGMVRHETRGCAICLASADMMAGLAAGRDRSGAVAMGRKFTTLLQTGQDGDALPDLMVFAPLHRHRSRIRCATLAWSALEAALTDGPADESRDG